MTTKLPLYPRRSNRSSPRDEYVIRQRLRWFIDGVRQPGSKAGRLAEGAGYACYHNLIKALRKRTALTPREVRRLTCNEVRELVDTKLALSGTGAPRT
jgi:hypothetical protein